jgi:hypothetical protein
VGVIWGTGSGSPGIASSIDGIEKDLIIDLSSTINIVFTGPWIDNFNDNKLDSCAWDRVVSGSGDPHEMNQQLQLWINKKNQQVGYVSKNPLALNGGIYFQVDITQFSNLKEMCIMVSPTKTTNSNPTSQNNWYRCYRTTSGNLWVVQSRLNGGTPQTLHSEGISTISGGSLKIMVNGGTIYFYDLQNNKQYPCTYSLSGKQYLYIYGSTGSTGNTYDYMDNWYYSGNSTSWLSGFSVRKPIYIAGGFGGAQTDYDIPVKLYYGLGSDGNEMLGMSTAAKVYAGGLCRSDFGDVRFTDCDGSTQLSYYMENSTADWALFWVKVPFIPAGFQYPQTAQIYIYSGNIGASTTSNGYNTFPMFDDFEGDTVGSAPSGWTVITKGTNDQFKVASDQVKKGAKSLYTYEVGGDGVNVAVKRVGSTTVTMGVLTAWMRTDSSNSRFAVSNYLNTGDLSAAYLLCRKDQGDWRYRVSSGTYYTVPNWGSVSSNTWYRLESFIRQIDNKVTYYNDRSSNSGWVDYNAATSGVDSIRIDSNYNYGGGGFWWDEIFLRKYVNPEPDVNYIGYWEGG